MSFHIMRKVFSLFSLLADFDVLFGIGLGVGYRIGYGFGYGVERGVAHDEKWRYSNASKHFHGPINLPTRLNVLENFKSNTMLN
ncbi:hypothetical protein NC653_029007 [Populus alba x Populus x berolinensis]|uniref:Glycine-rich protein n=1 Tax=Populus alba x Populus x berolinensis TaxID=444605 RepID=A0AAD6M1E4_9ROSI|nr:hypothetical protein NC653_029007 [Populus alba x Populus x berolinensis]